MLPCLVRGLRGGSVAGDARPTQHALAAARQRADLAIVVARQLANHQPGSLRETAGDTYEQQCPRCGRSFVGEDANGVADEVVEHARMEHRHPLDRNVVLAHLEGVRPDER